MTENETLLVKIAVQVRLPPRSTLLCVKDSEQNPYSVKIELFSKNDYFFLYKHTCYSNDYAAIRKQYSLKPTFPGYLTLLIKLFNAAIDDPDKAQCQLRILRDNSAELAFDQTVSFTSVHLLTIPFDQESEERTKMHIKHRYRLAKHDYEAQQANLKAIVELI